MTATTVTVGLVTSLTGPASSESANIAKAAQAHVDLQNAEGGVDGRQIKLVVKDDQSTSTSNATASEDLVQASHVFAVDNDSSEAFGGAPFLQKEGIPVVGAAWDGIEWGQQPYTNMFTWTGLRDPTLPGEAYSAIYLKDNGAKNVAVVSWALPGAAQSAKQGTKLLEYEGLKVGYQNYSQPPGGVNMTAVALGMKQAGVDSVLPVMGDTSNVALLVAAQQIGLKLKVSEVPSGYGQSLLGQSEAVSALQGASFGLVSAPVELHTPATIAWQAALAKYAHFTGIPGFDYEHGWISADLMIRGLEAAGSNPTRQSFITNLRKVTDYTAGGLLPGPINFAFGQDANPACGWYVVLKGTTFVLNPSNGKPVCGPVVPTSAFAKFPTQ